MKITDILRVRPVSLSFEIFPPKADSQYASVIDAAVTLCGYGPDFISVTYGAGGGTNTNTAAIAEHIQKTGVPAVAHLTCITSTKSDIARAADTLEEKGIENVLALRGDLPQNGVIPSDGAYGYASDLIGELKKRGKFCIGAACYPEGHPESKNRDADLDNLKRKVDAGCDFLTTQMFFDNDMLYGFLYRAQTKRVNVPVLAGIMPVTSAPQIKRMVALSNAYMPRRLLALIDAFGESPAALRQAGICYASEQIIDLIVNGIRGIHLYTMNKPDIAREILATISHIIAAANSR